MQLNSTMYMCGNAQRAASTVKTRQAGEAYPRRAGRQSAAIIGRNHGDWRHCRQHPPRRERTPQGRLGRIWQGVPILPCPAASMHVLETCAGSAFDTRCAHSAFRHKLTRPRAPRVPGTLRTRGKEGQVLLERGEGNLLSGLFGLEIGPEDVLLP